MRDSRTGAGSELSAVAAFRRALHGRATPGATLALVTVRMRREIRLSILCSPFRLRSGSHRSGPASDSDRLDFDELIAIADDAYAEQRGASW